MQNSLFTPEPVSDDRHDKREFSLELFPPKSPEAQQRLKVIQAKLTRLDPDFFSVTFGAGGSTRNQTYETVTDISIDTGIQSVPHISCFGFSKDDMRSILFDYVTIGFKRLIALRGDLPSGNIETGAFSYASDLVAFIRKETKDHFHIGVACYPEFHPQANSPEKDLYHFKGKVDAGADSAITQYFYNPDAYFRFIDACDKMHIEIPIVPGIMPITNNTQLLRFSEKCGAEIPRWILKRLLDFGDDKASIQAFGIDVVTNLCAKLLENGAPGLHIYTMNRAETAEAIWKDLNINNRRGLLPDKNTPELNDIHYC